MAKTGLDIPIIHGHVAPPMKVLAGVFMTLYIGLFLFVYVQLWMIWAYRHRRLSYQSAFLLTCLIFCALRIVVFSFYFNDLTTIAAMGKLSHWVLFSFPACIQFFMMCLLFLFFLKFYLKAIANSLGRPCYTRSKFACRIAVGCSLLLFVAMSIIAGVFVKPKPIVMQPAPAREAAFRLILARTVVSGLLFVAISLCFGGLIFRISRLSASETLLQGEGLTTCRSFIFGSTIVGLFLSKACYNLLAIALRGKFTQDSRWICISDQADFYVVDTAPIFIPFVVDLFLWELLPTLVLTIMFRVPIRSRVAAEPAFPVIGQNPTTTEAAINAASVATERSYFMTSSRYDTSDSPWPSTCTAPNQVPVTQMPQFPPQDVMVSPTGPLFRRPPLPGMPVGFHAGRRASQPICHPTLPAMEEVTGSSVY